MEHKRGLYIVLISVHGLIRGRDPELGRDADTGGQVQYVIDLARALATSPEVERVDLLTRQVLSINLAYEYAEHEERIDDKAWIVRLPCGPHRYLRKESLWPYLPQFVDNALLHFRRLGHAPDIIHGHYADAGEVARKLSRLLGTPFVFTGHSLGRVKRERLLAKGMDRERLEKRYKITRRIEAEEAVLASADLVVASTEQERDEQYASYHSIRSDRIRVIPPGINLGRFHPSGVGFQRPPIADEIERFLAHPRKPMILALQRPDERKNLATLIRAYAEHEELRQLANLVLMIGTRQDIAALPAPQRAVLSEMLLLIDRYDLYGSVAYPKQHVPEDVPDLYRLAARRRRGVFVNPALTEPFGLTLIEAAACGLPIVATNDGGPKVIVDKCDNGLLIDPLNADEMAAAIFDVLSDRRRWHQRSRAGIRGVERFFTWKGHVAQYLRALRPLRKKRRRDQRRQHMTRRMVMADQCLVCDIDNTLIGDKQGLEELLRLLATQQPVTLFAVATGRVLDSARKVLRQWGIPTPDVFITAVGSEIHYGRPPNVEDIGWQLTIDNQWEPARLREVLDPLPGVSLQGAEVQRDFKLSYFVNLDKAPSLTQIRRLIRSNGLRAQVIFSHDVYLDLLPQGASKGGAVRYLSTRWGLPIDRFLVAGDSGNDEEMLSSGACGVVVGNHSHELESLRGRDKVYFAKAHNARGVVEGLHHFGFFPGDESEESEDTDA